jgi:uncharacterized protein YidB (DUF937 family)
MANPFLGQILGSVLGQSMGGRSSGPFGVGMGGMGGMAGGGLGSVLGGMLGGGMGRGGLGMGGGMGRMGGMGGMGMGGGRSAMLALLLPLAMQWVQRNGGIGNVMQRVGQRGYGRQASSWLSTGENELIEPQAVQELVGRDELSRLSGQLGVGEDEVADGFAEILPEMVHHLSPDGEMVPDADQRLDAGQSSLSQMLADLDRQGRPD